jgi:hypothetical protein
VVLLAIALVIGLGLGLVRAPMGAHAVRPRLEQVPLLAVGSLLFMVSALLDGSPATLCRAVSLAVLIAVAMANRHLTGMVVIGLGLLLNLVGLAVNAGVAVRANALVEAGVVEPGGADTAELTGPRHLETSADALGVLGEVLPIPVVPLVVSFGDLIVAFGAADAVRELSRRRARVEALVDLSAYDPAPATTRVRADQVWGTAPRARPVSAAQYSENPDATAPATIDLDREAAAVRAYTDLVASQSR